MLAAPVSVGHSYLHTKFRALRCADIGTLRANAGADESSSCVDNGCSLGGADLRANAGADESSSCVDNGCSLGGADLRANAGADESSSCADDGCSLGGADLRSNAGANTPANGCWRHVRTERHTNGNASIHVGANSCGRASRGGR